MSHIVDASRVVRAVAEIGFRSSTTLTPISVKTDMPTIEVLDHADRAGKAVGYEVVHLEIPEGGDLSGSDAWKVVREAVRPFQNDAPLLMVVDARAFDPANEGHVRLVDRVTQWTHNTCSVEGAGGLFVISGRDPLAVTKAFAQANGDVDWSKLIAA